MSFLNLIPKINLEIKDKTLIYLGISILLLFLSIIFYFGMFWGEVYPNISVNNIPLSGMKKDKVVNILKEKSKENEKLKFNFENKIYEINPTELELEIKYNDTADKAMNLGRNKDFISDFKDQIEILKKGIDLDLEIVVNQDNLKTKVASMAAIINETEIKAEVVLINENNIKEASISSSRAGKTLNQERLENEIVKAYKVQDFSLKNLPVEINEEIISQQEKEFILVLANKLRDKKLILKLEDMSWEIGDEEMVNFLSIKNIYDNSQIVTWINELAKNIDREPEDALFQFEGGLVSEFRPAKKGLKLIKGDTVRDIRDGITELAKSEDISKEITLAVYEAEPKIKTEQANDLGIKELIGKGESWFSHSIASRVHNVELASKKMHGVLIPPGEEFSVLKYVAPIDGAHGYQAAYIIQNGRTILGDGGGVCQTSTTMFRAALAAGLPILERHPHAYRVDYYEQNYDVGLDASVFEPTADFRFRNDTPAHILVQTFVDTENLYAHYDLYGTSDGRNVTIGKTTIWSQTAPPPDIYQDDPTLAKDVIKQVDWRAWGAKVSFDWRVTRNGEVLQEQTFWTNYRPWAAVYLRGTREN